MSNLRTHEYILFLSLVDAGLKSVGGFGTKIHFPSRLNAVALSFPVSTYKQSSCYLQNT